MMLKKAIIPFLVLVLFAFGSTAQDNNYVYKDSTLLYEDSVATKSITAPPQEDDEEANDEDEIVVDTSLTSNQLTLEYDSVRALKNAKSFAYAKNLDSLLKAYQQSMLKEEKDTARDMSWLEILLLSRATFYFFWILAISFIGFILYKLFFTRGFFQQNYARAKVNVIPGETEKLSATADYGKLAAQAAAEGNYRVAVRFLYLQSLQKLTGKGLVQFAVDKTNYQYVSELSGKPYKKAFAALTLNYEYVWYGEFQLDGTLFNTIHNQFKQFNSEV